MATEVALLAARLSSSDHDLIKEALDSLTTKFASDAPAASELLLLEPALARLTTHVDWQVRRALAHALEHFHLDSFERLIGALAADENSYVRAAAQMVLRHRSDAGRTDMLLEEQDQALRALLSEIDGRQRERAREAAYKFAGLVVRQSQHELTKILNVISVAVGEIAAAHEKEPVDRAACRRPIELAEESTRLLARMFQSMNDLMKEMKPQFSTEHLSDVIDDAVNLADARGRADGFHVDVSKDAVELDRKLMVLGLSNVIKNALESYAGTSRTPHVDIRCAVEEGEQVSITISDKGCGMTPEQQRFRLFKTSKPGGTGFGLPFARRVIELAHRGTLRVRSHPGEGTRVTIRFPRVQWTEST